MGGSTYSYSNRSTRSVSLGYDNVTRDSLDTAFVQQRLNRVHESMNSVGITLREARDSEINPEAVPIILTMDVTGSMGDIPALLLSKGLPEIVKGIQDAGIPSPAILFMAIGDHETDQAPLQIGQFESGDEELDMWLTRTWIEGHGGANKGESYGLAHYFAARHCVTDHWEKRGKKGILITMGDEPPLTSYPASAMKEIMGQDMQGFNMEDIVKEAQEKWDVYHIDVRGGMRYGVDQAWGSLLGDNYVKAQDYSLVPDLVKDIVCKSYGCGVQPKNSQPEQETEQEEDITL